MAAWILIMALSGSHGGSIATQGFTTKEGCEAAGQAAASLGSLINRIRYVCVRG